MYTSEFLKNTPLPNYYIDPSDYLAQHKDTHMADTFTQFPYIRTRGIFKLDGVPCDLDSDIIQPQISYLCRGEGIVLGLLQIIELDSGFLFIKSDVRSAKNRYYIYTQNEVPDAFDIVKEYLLQSIWCFEVDDEPYRPRADFYKIEGAELYPINTVESQIRKEVDKYPYMRSVVGGTDFETGHRQLTNISQLLAIDKEIDIPDDTIFSGNAYYSYNKLIKKIGKNTQFHRAADFHYSGIEEVGDGVIFQGNADFKDCKHLKKIGKNVVFKWNADFHASGIEEIPDGTIFEKDVEFRDCKHLKKIGKNVVFKGDIHFNGSGIEEISDDLLQGLQVQIKIQTGKLDYIPDDTIFEGNAHFSDCKNLKRIGKNLVFKGEADFVRIEEIGDNSIFEGKVNFFDYNKDLKKIGKNVVFKGCTSLYRSGIEEIGDGVIFEIGVSFQQCENLKKIGKNVVFRGDTTFSGIGIEEIGDATIFWGSTLLDDCKNLKKIGKNVIFNGYVNCKGCGINNIQGYQTESVQIMKKIQTGKLNNIPDGTIFDRNADFEYCSDLKKIGKNVVFKSEVNLRYVGVEEIGDGTIFEKDADLTYCLCLKKIGKNVVFKGKADFSGYFSDETLDKIIEEIGDGTIFEKDVDFWGCKNLKRIGKNVVFKGNVDFRGSGIKELPPGVICESEVRFDL